jgi:hypothetical protein
MALPAQREAPAELALRVLRVSQAALVELALPDLRVEQEALVLQVLRV